MNKAVKIGLIGDYDPSVRAHIAIPHALSLAAAALNIGYIHQWIDTEELTMGFSNVLSEYDGLWCVPASPYKSMEGALNGIRYARENKIPFLGTCGGFQHTVIEFIRNVRGIKDAEHEEINSYASLKVIKALSCSLVGCSGNIFLTRGTAVQNIYSVFEIEEEYHCSYGVNSEYEYLFYNSEFRIAGRDSNNEIRIIEHKHNPFMIATLFQPELSALKYVVHPLIKSYLSAVFINKK